MRLHLPANSLSADSRVTLSRVAAPAAAPGDEMRFIVGPYELGLTLGVSISRPLSLRFSHDGQVYQETLTIYHWATDSETWEALTEDVTLQTSHHNIVAPITAPGLYALVGKPADWDRFLPLILK